MNIYLNKIISILIAVKDAIITGISDLCNKVVFIATHFDADMASKLWDYIVKSNLFNFVIFLAIIIYLMNKLDIKSAISGLQESIIKHIEETKKKKEDSIVSLKNAQDSVKNLQQDIDTIKEDAQRSAETIEKKILTEAEKAVKDIETNSQKVITAEEKRITSDLTKQTSQSAVENAEKQIKWALLKDLSLHQKYIDESIAEIDRLEI